MAQFNSRELRTWALKGAEQRLVEIAAEANAIHNAFPELRGKSAAPAASRSVSGTAAASAKDTRPRRAARQMSAEGRKRIAEAARRRWAEWRSKQGEGAPAAAESAAPPVQSARAPKKR